MCVSACVYGMSISVREYFQWRFVHTVGTSTARTAGMVVVTLQLSGV